MNRKEWIKKWKGNKRYTLKFVELVEEDQLTYKPTDGVKTYLSQLSHLATWMRTHSRFVTEVELEKVPLKTKEEVHHAIYSFFDTLLHYLDTAQEDALQQVVPMWYGQVSKEYILTVMDNHLAHHRGQLVVYQRLLGIKPPSYAT